MVEVKRIFNWVATNMTIVIFITLFSSIKLQSQSYPQNSLYLIDLYSINPAYAGLDRSLSANFNYRDQWSGFEANPQQLYVNAHLPVYLLDGGAGVSLRSDQLGALRFNTINFSYNRIINTEFGIISGGLSLGLRNTSLDGSTLITPEGIYLGTTFDHQDQFLSTDVATTTRLQTGLGIFLGSRRFDFGISVDNIFFKGDEIGNITTSNHDVVKVFARAPVVINDLILYPSLLLKTNFDQLQTDISCLVKSGNIFGGMSLRGYGRNSIDSAVLIGGIRVNDNYTISYSYDIGLSNIRIVSQGVHEVNINYNLNKLIGLGLPPEIIYNPRNL